MQADTIDLRINGKSVPYVSYSVESSLFAADDAWEVETPGSLPAKVGDKAKLYVNHQLELVGLVEAVSLRTDKKGARATISGRDYMGILTGYYLLEGKTLDGQTLSGLAKDLLADVPYVSGMDVIYGQGDKSRAAELTDRGDELPFDQLSPGVTVFEALKAMAMAHGMLFWATPDGKFVFGQPATGGAPGFFIRHTQSGTGNNVISASMSDDISGRHSVVYVIGQNALEEGGAAGDAQAEGSAEDSDFPYQRPYVATLDKPGVAPDAYARILLDKQRFDGFSLTYTVPGHSQNGKNYSPNAVCRVADDVMGVSGSYLIHGRRFEMSRDRGPTTTLQLSKLGVLPA